MEFQGTLIAKTIFKKKNRDFPGSLVFKNLRFHCREPGLDPGCRELRSRMPCSVAKKKKNKIVGFMLLCFLISKLTRLEYQYRVIVA